jgi:hypothetical protein
MQSRLGRAVISTVVCGAVALMAAGSVAFASTPPGGTVSLPPLVVMATPAVGHKLPPGHPEINGAIRALERAKTHLQAAAHDFNGHRADALAACDQAIKQLQIIIAYDK